MDTKKCIKCGEVRPVTEFYAHAKRPDGLQNECIPCKRAYQADWYQRNKEKHVQNTSKIAAINTDRNAKIIMEAKAVPCADCGETYPYYVMDFDHLPGYIKFRNVGAMRSRTTEKRLREEIAKCEVVCANCHRERTFNRKPFKPS